MRIMRKEKLGKKIARDKEEKFRFYKIKEIKRIKKVSVPWFSYQSSKYALYMRDVLLSLKECYEVYIQKRVQTKEPRLKMRWVLDKL